MASSIVEERPSTGSLSYNDLAYATTTPSTVEQITNEIIDYFETHKEMIPLLVVVYTCTIIWILYLILYHSRTQGLILSYLLQRFYFKQASQIQFDSLSISFISGSIMFRNLHFTTGTYFVFIRDGCLTFRYWSSQRRKPLVRLTIQLNHFDLHLYHPIRSNATNIHSTSVNDERTQGLNHG
jgi:hypothetical protein